MKEKQSVFFAFLISAVISGVILPLLWLVLIAFFTDIKLLFDFDTKMPLLLFFIPLTMFASYCALFHGMYRYFRSETLEPR